MTRKLIPLLLLVLVACSSTTSTYTPTNSTSRIVAVVETNEGLSRREASYILNDLNSYMNNKCGVNNLDATLDHTRQGSRLSIPIECRASDVSRSDISNAVHRVTTQLNTRIRFRVY